MPYVDIVVKFYSSRTVEFHLFQRLTNDIIWLALRGLCRLDDGGFVNVSSVVYIELAEGILQLEDLVLLKLWVFPKQCKRLVGGVTKTGACFTSEA